MKLIQNRVADEYLHEELLDAPLFPSVSRGKLCAQLFLPEGYGKDDDEICVYEYPVGKVVDLFISFYVRHDTGKFSGLRDIKRAHQVIADLESMIAALRRVLPDSPHK